VSNWNPHWNGCTIRDMLEDLQWRILARLLNFTVSLKGYRPQRKTAR